MSGVLDIEGLTVRLPGPTGYVTVVEDVWLSVGGEQVFGVAGESGSGKTMSMLAVMGLLPPGAVTEGRILFGGRDLLSLRREQLREICGRELAMVFQDPMSSLHPMLSVGRQMTEHTRHHLGLGRKEARARAAELLDEVRIPDAEAALEAFPHQFSGGMRQRIAIAMALACDPKILIADEPTTSLDVTVQAGIIRLLDRLRRHSGLSIVLITHNLGLMSAIADRVTIFYAGRVVESGPAARVMLGTRHPYTRGLLDALPHPGVEGERPLVPIAGAPPSPQQRPSGCAFHPRCGYAEASCRTEVPAIEDIGEDRMLACPVDPLRTAS